MKYKLMVLPLAMILSASVSQAADYKNDALGISCQYPEGWTTKENQMTKDPTIVAGTAITFVSPKEDSKDPFRDTVGVVVRSYASDMTLQRFSDMQIKSAQKMKDAKVLSSEDAQVAGLPGHQIVFTAKQTLVPGKPGTEQALKLWKRWTVKGNKAYVVRYQATEDKYDQFYPKAEALAKSLSLSK